MSPIQRSVIEQIEKSSGEVLASCQNVPTALLIAPSLPNGRSIKDALAHIAAWVWRCAALLNHAHENDHPLQARPDEEALSREFFEERRNWSWYRVEADFRQAHRSLFEAINGLPPSRLDDPLVQQTIARETWGRYAQYLTDLEDRYRRHSKELALVS